MEHPQQLSFLPIQDEDIPQVLAIERAVYEFPWSASVFQECAEKGLYHCQALRKQDIILGYSIDAVIVDECHLLNFCIAPQFQRTGYGLFMLNQLIVQLKQCDVSNILLEVRESNQIAYKLYTTFGFKPIGHRKDYYPSKDGREDAIIMSLSV